jgi:hypothetical protein
MSALSLGADVPTPAPAWLQAWRRATVAQVSARFLARQPGARPVVLGPALRVELPTGRQPWLLLAEDLLTRLPAPDTTALLRWVGERAPAGSLLLADAAGARWPVAAPWQLPDVPALCAPHPRLRVDEVHRLPGWRATAWALLGGVPPWALYEIGVDA